MSLPTPDVTTRSFSRAPTAASSRKSTASVHDSDYREKLENYNTYVRRQRPPPGLWQEAEKMVFRRRDSPEMEGTAIDQLKDTIREIQTASEDEIRTRLGVHIIPGYSKPSDKRLHVIHGDLWCKTVPTPYSSTLVDPPLPLPKPKPDTTFAFSKTAFTESQLGIIKSLVQFPNGPSFASPHQDVRFPFAVVEYKSQARGGTIYIATNQAAGAGAVAMNGFLELMIRGPGLDAFDVNKPLFFSVTMDLEMPTSIIQVLQRALKNIHDYAAEDLLKFIVDALDEYRDNKIKGGNAKRQAEAEPHTPPSLPKLPQNKRTRRAAPKTPQEATGPSTQYQRDIQTQDEAHRPRVRTRRTAMLDDS
ncbi:MAG: hypothetical protein LQ352_006209 [Teloschistes flavicans]|nr:MAG: hypothetical protein LQ352_006209 [Teloschistes flavicans]